jgi:hypothetical protein
VTPGKYYLGVNTKYGPNADNPYPTAFYPGTPDKTEASVIDLADGQWLDGFSWQLLPPLVVRTIQGVIVWSDGSPVTLGNASIADSPDGQKSSHFYGSAQTDAQGHFTLKVLDGVEGWLCAESYKGGMKGDQPVMIWLKSKPIKVTVTEDKQSLKLVIPLPEAASDPKN